MKSIIVYQGKYGATRQYAQWLGEAIQTPVYDAASVAATTLAESDIIIIGSSVYVGRLLISKWLKKNEVLIKNKKLLFFIVCGTPSGQQEKLQQIIKKSIPDLLSSNAMIHFLRGRMIIRKLSWTDRLMLKLGAAVTRDPVEKKEMLRNFDGVKKENLAAIIRDFRSLVQHVKSAIQRSATIAKT